MIGILGLFLAGGFCSDKVPTGIGSCPPESDLVTERFQSSRTAKCVRRQGSDRSGSAIYHGPYLLTGPDGSGEQGEYRDGKPIGTWCAWGRGGHLLEQRDHRGCSPDECYEITGWHPNQRKAFSGQRRNGSNEGTWWRWYANGRPESAERYSRSGRKVGRWTRWYESGGKAEESEWQDDRLMDWRGWDANGRELPAQCRRDDDCIVVPSPHAACCGCGPWTFVKSRAAADAARKEMDARCLSAKCPPGPIPCVPGPQGRCRAGRCQ